MTRVQVCWHLVAMLPVQWTRAHDVFSVTTARDHTRQKHHVMEDTVDVTSQYCMMAAPVYVSWLLILIFLHVFKSSNYNVSTAAHVSGCLIKKKPGTYVGLPSTDGSPETTFYGCVSTATNCEYDVHVIANYESSNGHHGPYIRRVAGDTYVTININGQSSKPLILVFTSYEPVNWQLSLPSGVVLNRILLVGSFTMHFIKYSNHFLFI